MSDRIDTLNNENPPIESLYSTGENHACQINSHLPTQDRTPGQQTTDLATDSSQE